MKLLLGRYSGRSRLDQNGIGAMTVTGRERSVLGLITVAERVWQEGR
jgi:hypothetical protein